MFTTGGGAKTPFRNGPRFSSRTWHFYFEENYPDKVNFFVYDGSKAADYVYRERRWPKFGSEIVDEFKGEGGEVDNIPKMIMYSPFDVVEEETPSVNDGIVEFIDAVSGGVGEGGPRKEPGVTHAQKFLKGLIVYWIKPNLLLELSPKGKVYRFYNGYKYIEVR